MALIAFDNVSNRKDLNVAFAGMIKIRTDEVENAL